MSASDCKKCLGTGVVCKAHRSKPWEGEGACVCGEMGTACECNPDGEYDFDYVIASINESEVTTKH